MAPRRRSKSRTNERGGGMGGVWVPVPPQPLPRLSLVACLGVFFDALRSGGDGPMLWPRVVVGCGNRRMIIAPGTQVSTENDSAIVARERPRVIVGGHAQLHKSAIITLSAGDVGLSCRSHGLHPPSVTTTLGIRAVHGMIDLLVTRPTSPTSASSVPGSAMQDGTSHAGDRGAGRCLQKRCPRRPSRR